MRWSRATSASRGTLSRTSVLSVSKLAIINGKVAFFAPEIGIVPLSLWPPWMRMRSMPPPRLPANARCSMNRGGRARNARTRRKVAAPGLALLFMPANSGGIVGLGGPCRAGARRAGFRLGLAPLEILPQRRAQAPALPHLLRALFPIVHGRKTTTGRHATEASRRDRPFHGARLRHVRPCGKDRSARAPFLIGRFSHPARRCRSSVVEHPLGKGEVVSSILTGSTDKSGTSQNRPRQIGAEQSRILRAYSHQISTKCSGDVHYLQDQQHR